MSEEISIEKLREEVNPVYSTAHSCLQIVASMGDEDSENLRKELGFTFFGADWKERGANVPEEVHAALIKAMPVFNAMPESRFYSSNNFILQSGVKQVMDLPCGYTARGVKLAKSGIRYFGMDLPAVISGIEPAVRRMIGDNGNISYHEVDATNYASLRKANDFKADVELVGKTLNVALAGRLDTITAPGLLELYRKAGSKGGYDDIRIDMKELEYVSSAGLRVLLIMRKALTDSNSFNLVNMNDSVKEIIETTGFDSIFC